MDAFLMRFVPNIHFAREISRQVEFRDGMVQEAEEVLHEAKVIAPVRTGTYRESLSVLVTGSNVYVRSTDWKAWMLEYGTVDTPTFATIRRAVISSGLRLDESHGIRDVSTSP